MEPFLHRPKAAIQELLKANGEFNERIRAATPSHELPKSRLDALSDISDRLPTCVAALSQSLFLIEKTSLDVVDMETRMQNESGQLADLLDELGENVRAQFFIKKYFEDSLISLEEQANALAAGLFPSAVQGLNKVNSKLWEFTNLQMIIYGRTLDRVRPGLSAEQCKNVESGFENLRKPFDALNQFLNALALRTVEPSAIEERFNIATGGLSEARDLAKASLKVKEFSEFRSILNASISIAGALQNSLKSVRVPVFPAHPDLGELSQCIGEDFYSNLTGLQAFALLNIGSRMHNITINGTHMLSPAFGIEIFNVFPDRIYFRAKESFLQTIQGSGLFVPADASLHKFRAGSYKLNMFAEGNLQFSHGPLENGRINVDADIDLYRNPLLHAFGEVLHNHLTGKKTDSYKVRRILDEQNVQPIGGFRIVSMS